MPFLFIPLVDRQAVAQARLAGESWKEVMAGQAAREIFVFSEGGERAGSQIHSRMFAPAIGIAEDPATGGAAVALAAYLAARSSERDGTLKWVVEQGFEMGRPSILEAEADKEAGRVVRTRVGGSTVLMTEGELSL
jgi:trans-2,3-dihydro-3-hydroxyanthranilate isomerase